MNSSQAILSFYQNSLKLKKMQNRNNKGSWFFKIVFLGIFAFTAVSWIVMLLWNWLMPPIFNLTTITIFQAGGLLILSKILFGFGSFGNSKHNKDGHWRHKMKDKWQNMSEEEKTALKQKMKDKWTNNKC